MMGFWVVKDNDVLNGGVGVDMMAGGIGNDTFICDLFDTIIDFNSNQGDKIIGQCSPVDQVEDEASSDIIPQENFHLGSSTIPILNLIIDIPAEDFQAGPPPQQSFDSNNIDMEEFESLPPPPPPQQQQQSFDSNNIDMEEFESLPPPPPPPPPPQQQQQSFDSNKIQVEEHKLPPPGPPRPQSPPPFSHNDLPPEDFGSLSSISVPPSNEKYMSGPFFN